MSEDISEDKPAGLKRLETYCGLLLAVFAAVLAITDLGAGRYGDDEMIAVNEKSSAYLWYQSKGIKHDLTEGRAELLESLVSSGTISPDKKPMIDSLTIKLRKKMDKYDLQKDEILRGSSTVGKDKWVQGLINKETGKEEFGNIIGAEQWQETADKLGDAGDYFDGATLFLQLCIVMGAISLISPTDSSKKNFFYGMIILGIIGSVITTCAFVLAAS